MPVSQHFFCFFLSILYDWHRPKNDPFGIETAIHGRFIISTFKKGLKWSDMVNLTLFYLLGLVWVHLDTPSPFQTKNEFLSRLRWGPLQQKIIPKVRTEMFWIEVFDFLPEHLIELHEKENIWSLAWWKDPACSRRPNSFHQIHFSTSLMSALMTIHSF